MNMKISIKVYTFIVLFVQPLQGFSLAESPWESFAMAVPTDNCTILSLNVAAKTTVKPVKIGNANPHNGRVLA